MGKEASGLSLKLTSSPTHFQGPAADSPSIQPLVWISLLTPTQAKLELS